MKLNKKQSLVAVAVVTGFAAQSALAEDISGVTTWPPLAAGTAAAVTLGEACGYGQNVVVNNKTTTKSGQKSASVAKKVPGASELSADDVPQTAWTETIELVPVTALAEMQPAPKPAQVEEAAAAVKKAVAVTSGKPKTKLAGKGPAKSSQSGSYAYGGTGNCVTDMLVVGGKFYSGVLQIPTNTKVSTAPAKGQAQSAPKTVAWAGTR